jgi:nucleotide-binding universal stress UspA family protein
MPASHTMSELLSGFAPVQVPSGPILVASDTSPASDAAFPMARVLAGQTSAAVQVISALRPNAMPTYAFDAVPYPVAPTPDMLDGRASLVSTQMQRLIPAVAPWPVVVRSGDPVREIVERAKALDARLVIVGRGRHGMLERVLGGESVLRMLQLGDTPVLAVESTLESLPKRVVVSTDFSVFSVYAAQVALDFVAPQATIELVHVAPSLSEVGPVMRDFAAEYRQQVKVSFEALVDRLQRPGLVFETTLLEGNASTRLVDHLRSHPADLVVSATHGYGFLRRMMLGSVTAELVRSAPGSVLCVPGSARTLAAARAQAAALHDSTRQLPLATLDAELAAFSARHRGRACSVEVNQRDVGAHVIGHHLALAGLTYEREGNVITLMFGPSSEAGRHLSHQVHGCQLVEVVQDGQGHDQLLRISHEGGQTWVVLE